MDDGEAGGGNASKGQSPAGVHQPSVLPDVALDTVREDKQGCDGGRDDQLDHQDAVDSLDEATPHRLVGLFRLGHNIAIVMFSGMEIMSLILVNQTMSSTLS